LSVVGSEIGTLDVRLRQEAASDFKEVGPQWRHCLHRRRGNPEARASNSLETDEQVKTRSRTSGGPADSTESEADRAASETPEDWAWRSLWAEPG
jgi:hypothetical protein